MFQDPEVDDEPVEVGTVTIHRQVEVPALYVTRKARLGLREAVRVDRSPGSAWLIDLGGKNVPVTHLQVKVAEPEFARDYQLQVFQEGDVFDRFVTIKWGELQRRPGEKQKPPVIKLDGEINAERLRLLVADHANPPLTVEEILYTAPARQIVFPASRQWQSPLRLYYGNPEGQPPQYDFARNLPERLDDEPLRAQLAGLQINPDYVPPPKALTERWPWLVYVALGVVSLVLAALIYRVAQTSIQRFDQETAAAPEA